MKTRRELVAGTAGGMVLMGLGARVATALGFSRTPTNQHDVPSASDLTRVRIAGVDVFALSVPFKKPHAIATGVIPSVRNVLVRLRTDAGVYGLGEGCPLPLISGESQDTCIAAAHEIASVLNGKAAIPIEARMREVDAALAANPTIKSAFDMALYDILGKLSRLPLYALLGGENRPVATHRTVSLDTPESMAATAAEYVGAGFEAIKLKVGTGIADDVARVRAVRLAIGGSIPIRVDANQGWDEPTAVAALEALAPFGVQFCEQPVAHWDLSAMARITSRSPIPVMADESLLDHHDAYRLASLGACNYFNVKLTKCGGVHNALRVIAIAEGAGLKCQAGCMGETRLGLSALAHLAAARDNIAFADIDSAFRHAIDPVEGGITYKGGKVTVPETPGIGADIDPRFLATLTRVSF